MEVMQPRASAPRARIVGVEPCVDCGRYAAKRIVGESVEVAAIVIADGHVQLRAELRYRVEGARRWERAAVTPSEHDLARYVASFVVDGCGAWEFSVSAWIDAAETWRDELRRKFEAGQSDLSA